MESRIEGPNWKGFRCKCYPGMAICKAADYFVKKLRIFYKIDIHTSTTSILNILYDHLESELFNLTPVVKRRRWRFIGISAPDRIYGEVNERSSCVQS